MPLVPCPPGIWRAADVATKTIVY